MRGPVSIAFDLVKRGIVTDPDPDVAMAKALKRVEELLPRPDIAALLKIGTCHRSD